MILETLKISGSDFFEKFAVFLSGRDRLDIEKLQLDFVKELFEQSQFNQSLQTDGKHYPA
jgi:hypothetical protein